MTRLARSLPALVVLGGIAMATLSPGTIAEASTPMFCLVCGSLGTVDVILNVALFLPLGWALAFAGMSWRQAIVTCLATSLAIESLQFAVIAGRDATISDLLTNTLGGAIGAWTMAHWRPLVASERRQAQCASMGFAAAALLIMAATAWLLRPALPRMLLWGQWTPQHQQFEPYSGHLATFAVNRIPIPYGLIAIPDSVRTAYLRYEAVPRIEFLSGHAPQRTSAIARIGGERWELFLLGASGERFVFRASLRTRYLRLRTPSAAVAGALGGAGENVTAEAQLQRDGWRMRVSRPSGTVERLVPFSVALGWSMLLPFEHPMEAHDVWWSAVWLGALVFPCALWGALARLGPTTTGSRGRTLSFLPVASVAAGLAVIPWAAHFAPASPIEWGGVLLGAALATWLAPWLKRRALQPSLQAEDGT
ncbi:MAG: VanZ family protein [Gemmatimonadaceae bacterium]|nr:VanZ family protein [Gemmatimonadaceae bacterium]